jgi:hypothetical protein
VRSDSKPAKAPIGSDPIPAEAPIGSEPLCRSRAESRQSETPIVAGSPGGNSAHFRRVRAAAARRRRRDDADCPGNADFADDRCESQSASCSNASSMKIIVCVTDPSLLTMLTMKFAPCEGVLS